MNTTLDAAWEAYEAAHIRHQALGTQETIFFLLLARRQWQQAKAQAGR